MRRVRRWIWGPWPAASALGVVVDVVRLDGHTGVAAARNIAARRATTRYVLNLDDDAFLVDADSVSPRSR